MKAQLPRYQRLVPRPGQAHAAAPPVAAVGSIMAPQQGMPPQQPGMRHPMHGKEVVFSQTVSEIPNYCFLSSHELIIHLLFYILFL